MPGPSGALTKEFLENLYKAVTGREINVVSPEMGATAEGSSRLFRGENIGNKADRETGQMFTESLPDAIGHSRLYGSDGAVSAVDIPDGTFDRSSNAGRAESGRKPLQKVTGGVNAPTEQADLAHFLVRKLANKKQQIIPTLLGGTGVASEFYKALNGVKGDQLPSAKEAGVAAMGMVPGAMELSTLPDSLQELTPSYINDPANSTKNTGLDADSYSEMMKHGINPGGSPWYEPKGPMDDLTLGKAMMLLGAGGSLALKKGGDAVMKDFEQRPINRKMATERIPPGSGIKLSDLKDIGNETYPAGGASNSPVEPIAGPRNVTPQAPKQLRGATEMPGEVSSSKMEVSTPETIPGTGYGSMRGVQLGGTLSSTGGKVISSKEFPTIERTPDAQVLQARPMVKPPQNLDELRAQIARLDADKQGFTDKVAAQKAGEPPQASPTSRQMIQDYVRNHPVLSGAGGAVAAAVLEKMIEKILFGGRP